MGQHEVSDQRRNTVDQLRWPSYASRADLAAVESIPLNERGLPATTYAALAEAAHQWPARDAVTVLPTAAAATDARTLSYGDLLDRVHRVANVLTSAGAQRQTAIGLISPNSEELISALIGAQTAGIAMPVNPSLSADHLVDLLRRAEVEHLIVAGAELDRDVWTTAVSIAGMLKVKSIWVLRPTGAASPAPTLEPIAGVRVEYLRDAAEQQTGERLLADPPAASDLAAFFHTGGTTGTPKLAAHLHSNEIADAWMMALNPDVPDDAVFFGALPLFHVNALIVTLLAPMLRGQHVIWAGPLGYREPDLYQRVWRLVEHFRISVLSGVPTVYAELSRVPVDADISSLRFGMVGASPLPSAVRDAFQQATGVPLCEGYGLTEATCATTRNFISDPRPGWVGQRLPYQKVKAVEVDPQTGEWKDLPPNTVGVLAISGPTVFPGYVVGRAEGRPVLDTCGRVVAGWLDTGDLALVDEYGYVQLRGRAKDVIIRGGHNIDPASIEDALLLHDAVTGAAAVGRPHPVSGEVPVAYITTRPGATVTEKELTAWAAAHVPEPAAIPKSIIEVDHLPQTAVGKPYKVPLREDATRSAVYNMLATYGIEHVQVTSRSLHGSVHVDLTAEGRSEVDWDAVAAALARFTFSWAISEET